MQKFPVKNDCQSGANPAEQIYRNSDIQKQCDTDG